MKETWPYADNVLDPCFPDPCNSQGLCSVEDESYSCACINGYTGDTCDEVLDDCDADYCENGGTCYWASAVQSCFCATGYTGDTCSEFSEELNDACLNLVCGDEGAGTCVVNSENVGECVCVAGFTGDFCTIPTDTCTATQYMDLVQQLLLTNPEYSEDCSYLSTQLWAMIPIQDGYPGLCECLSAMKTYIPDSLSGLECSIDKGLTLTDAFETYCAMDCTQDTIDEMLTTVSAMSDDCYHYIYNGDTMPLYRQNDYQCSCMLGVADTYEEALEVFSCPMKMTTASSGAIAWQNCNDDLVCDFQHMYNVVREEMYTIDAVSGQACMDLVAMMSMSEVISSDLSDLRDAVSPCLEGIYTKWPEGIATFNCKPVTTYEVTMKEIMEKVTQDTQFYQPTCTYSLSTSVFDLAVGDFSGASMCLQAAILGDQIATVNDNFDELFCGCYDRLVDIESFDASYMDQCAADIDWIVPSPQSYCEDYFGKTYSFLSENVYPETSLASESTDEVVWTTVAVILTIVLIALIALNFWIFLTTNKSTAYNDMKEGTTTAATSG